LITGNLIPSLWLVSLHVLFTLYVYIKGGEKKEKS
jgi:hypothetical protein